MNRYPSTRKARQRAGLPPGPLFRDVAPDREPFTLYDDRGNVAMQSDLPTALMDRLRRAARKHGVTAPSLFIAFLRDKLDEVHRGY